MNILKAHLQTGVNCMLRIVFETHSMGYNVYLSDIGDKLYNKTMYIIFHFWLDSLIKQNSEHPHDTLIIVGCSKRLIPN